MLNYQRMSGFYQGLSTVICVCVCVCLKMVYIPKMALVGGFNHLEKYESQWEG